MRLGPLNLTWWRKRPRVHVAERFNYCQVVDMNLAINLLDIAESPFTTLLNALDNKPMVERFDSKAMSAYFVIGDLVRSSSGRTGHVIARPLKDPDDWFSNERLTEIGWDTFEKRHPRRRRSVGSKTSASRA